MRSRAGGLRAAGFVFGVRNPSQALQRLREAGHDPKEARQLVGYALANALVVEELEGSVEIDREDYVHSLESFPDLSVLAEDFDLDDTPPW